MIFDNTSNPEIMDLINEFTTCEKVRNQLCERIIDGKTYAEMGLFGNGQSRYWNDYIDFRKHYDKFLLFAEKQLKQGGKQQ